MKTRSALLGIGAACAACCAPLLLPLIGGTGVLAAWASVSADTLVCGAVIAGLGAFGAWRHFARRKQPATTCDCADTCSAIGGKSPGS